MNQCLIDFLKDKTRAIRLVQGLPPAFEIRKNETPRGNPAVGTNHRGITITRRAIERLRKHPTTTSASVDWIETGLTQSPHDRWVEYWNRC